MNYPIYLTTSEYEEEGKRRAEMTGGLVLTSGSASLISNNDESTGIWTYQPVWWKSIQYYGVDTYTYADVESDLLKKKVIIDGVVPLLSSVGTCPTYAAVLSDDHVCISESQVLSCTADILRAYGNDVVVLSSNAHINQTTLTMQDERIATTAMVKSIEKELGVDLQVDSDSELHSILRKNGAGPLSGLLEMAYGTKKEKTESKR